MAISPWSCTRCGAVNASTATACVVCGQARESVAGGPPPSGEASSAWTPPAWTPPASTEPAATQPSAPEPAAPESAAEWSATPGAAADAAAASDQGPGAIPGWQPSTTPTPEAPRSTGSRILGLLRPLGIVAVIAVVAAGAWWFSAKRDDSGAITDAGDLSSLELRVGDCFDLKDATAEYIGDVDARPCAETHEYEVFLVQDMPDGDFPSEATFDSYVADACLPAFATFVGLAYEQSELEIFYLVPSEDSWSEGDRAVMCAVYHPRIDELTGSLKGSGR